MTRRLYIPILFLLAFVAGNTHAQNRSIGGIINLYTPVTGFIPCENKIVVTNAAGYNAGDTVLIIQMKGAIIDSSNTAAFGTVTQYRNAGNYEMNIIKTVNANIIELKNIITRQYDIPDGNVQLIRVPYYNNATVTSTLTCPAWDGSTGGVAVIQVADTLILNADINVNGKGFRGGAGYNSQSPVLNCNNNNYYYPQSDIVIAGQKGEGIAHLSPDRNYGKGNNANGGGGGLGHNSGGGGGSNISGGGFGGYQLNHCGGAPFDNRGIGGFPLQYTNAANKIFMGGGGGAGQADNPGNPVPNGGNGAGIVIIIGNVLRSNNFKIQANGNDASTCSIPPAVDCHDAMGGGGAGGTIVLQVNQYLTNILTELKGGKGADMVGSVPLGGRIGSGGGGAGGALIVKNPAVSTNIINTNTGGPNGVLTQDGNIAWGAEPGFNGSNLTNFNFQFDLTPFRPNIDSVRFNDLRITCNEFDFRGLGYVNTNPVASWQWTFGDGGTASTQDVIYSYSNPGPFTVKLVVTDINGCKDSTSKLINPSFLTLDAGPGDTICTAASTQLQGLAVGAVSYSWTPAQYLSNPAIPDPVATPPLTTLFYLSATNAAGCTLRDSVEVMVRSDAGFSINPPVSTCINDPVSLQANGGDLYTWSPAASLDNAGIANPIANPLSTTTYTVDIRDTLCNLSATLNTIVQVRPLPVLNAIRSNDIDCAVSNSRLGASGAVSYNWSPAASLNNPLVSSPLATPVVTTTYQVTGTDGFGCVGRDSVIVKVTKDNKVNYQMPTAFTPNNDGLNDCYGVKLWGQVLEIEFSIYNRWGERIFFTRNPSACWDGTVRGVQQDPAVFVYMIRARTNCDNYVFRKGTFALIR